MTSTLTDDPCQLTATEVAALGAATDIYRRVALAVADELKHLLSNLENAFNDGSAAWRESEAGAAARQRIATLQGWLDDLDLLVFDLTELA